MKKIILYNLFLIAIVINFIPTYAVKDAKNKSDTLTSAHVPPKTETSGKKKYSRKFLTIPTCVEILNAASDSQQRELASKKYQMSEVLSSAPEETFETMLMETEKELKLKNKYCHDAYTSLEKFNTRFYSFLIYFKKIVRTTKSKQYFSEKSHELTQQASETIREFMTPSEYLNEVEKIIFCGDTFDSQVVSEVLSRKLSELGIENYILQITPNYIDTARKAVLNNNGLWVILYRDYADKWYIADFSLALKYKFNRLILSHSAIAIPFFEYINPIINGTYSESSPCYRNIVYDGITINFSPGFYGKSDDYYLADISYLPFNFFVCCKLAIEQTYGIDQHIEEIKSWLDQLEGNPNYKVEITNPENLLEMTEYMINYLLL